MNSLRNQVSMRITMANDKAMQLSMTKAKGHNKKWLLAYANEIKESGLLCAL